MTFRAYISIIALITLSFSVKGQDKKKIDFTCYDEWKTIRAMTQSPLGDWICYEIAPLEGDAELVIESIESGKKRTFERGKNALFLPGESVIIFAIEPEYDTLRKLKLAQTNKDKLPKDSLAIYWLETDSLVKFPSITSFQLSKEKGFVVYLSSKDERPNCADAQTKRQRKKNPCTNPATSGFTLTILNPSNGASSAVHCVTSYSLDETGNYLAYVKSIKGKKDTLSLDLRDLNNMLDTTLVSKQFAINQLTFDTDGEQFAFLTSNDTNKLKKFSLHYINLTTSLSSTIVDSNYVGMQAGWNVSENGSIYFSENNTRLFLGTNKLVTQEPKDTLLETEKAKVDVWGTNDPRIQPQQLIQKNRDQKKTYLAVFDLSTHKLIQLGNETIPNIRLVNKGNANYALGITDENYLRETTWEYPWKSDYLAISLEDGSNELIKSGHPFTVSLSPSGDYFIYYDGADSNWYSVSRVTKQVNNLTKSINAVFATDNNGNPSPAEEEGFIGYTLIDGQEYCLVQSTYDIWALNVVDPKKSFSPSEEKGISEKIQFTYRRVDIDSTYTLLENNFFVGIHQDNMDETIYQIDKENSSYKVIPRLTSGHKIIQISKAEKSDRVILRRMNFIDYPDLEKTTISFENPIKITSVNEQQSQYNWGTVEMVSWKSFEGRQLRGLLYKPEDFDSLKSYPMIVYFYEKYTRDIHNYYAPKPTASIIYPTEYVSNGYIIFIPDIEYTPGYPAKSAYDCIVSGTDYLIRKHNWIDSTRLGLQGQSWGGYQTAQLITMTNKYKVAMAGAPVTNMISAYGGIRWGSGLSRMFQYEKTQSRIGFTLWERPDLYMLNSPIFGLPNVSTPLLIMSNDGDGAVPWYQGIEMYMGLRRLNKPVWLLNYNGDEHNLIQLANKRDLSIRMRQFFDYYLLDGPLPIWMSTGIPATEKGKTYGFETENSDD